MPNSTVIILLDHTSSVTLTFSFRSNCYPLGQLDDEDKLAHSKNNDGDRRPSVLRSIFGFVVVSGKEIVTWYVEYTFLYVP